MSRLPFMATVVFTRGKICQHNSTRQCNDCFIISMHQYNEIVDIDALVQNYMAVYKQDSIEPADSLTCLLG